MSDLVQRVEATILGRKLFRFRGPILVAVSGGVDSMVLLHLFATLAPRHRWRLMVAHFNHQLRGRSSDADERLVRQTARRLGVKCVVGSSDVRSIAKDKGVSIEMAARECRHDFLARTAVEHGARVVALAHHADDQVELFFLRLLRGAGSQGLAGMKRANPSPANARLKLVRPLLDCSKAELTGFAQEQKIVFREDATNVSQDVLRNRVRHELLPLLTRGYQPALQRTILRQMEILRAESDLLQEMAEKWREKDGAVFASLPVALQRKVLQIELNTLSITPDFDLVERLRISSGQPTAVSARTKVMHDGRGNVRKVRPAGDSFSKAGTEIELAGGRGRGIFDGLKWSWQMKLVRNVRLPRFEAGCEWFDADLLGTKLRLRHWLPGDRFQPAGMAKAVKLQDLFTNMKVPRDCRHRLVVATTADGQIWWVEGLRISERFKLKPGTRRRLRWNWRRLAVA